jgi:hypothetical protein
MAHHPRVDGDGRVEDAESAWAARFADVAALAGVEPIPPAGWALREGRCRHLCRLLSLMLDDEQEGTPRRAVVARAYARAFGLFVEAGQRRVDTVRPPG